MYSLLIVDDQSIVREGVCSLLKELNFNFSCIYQAPDSRRAIEIIERYKPSILLLDIVMPGDDGFSVIKYIKENNIKVNIIIITSHDQFDYAVKAIKYNVDDFLMKPVNKMELYQALYKVISRDENLKGMSEDKLFYFMLLGYYMEGKRIEIDTDQLFLHTGLKNLVGQKLKVLYFNCRSSGMKDKGGLNAVTAELKRSGAGVVYYAKSGNEFVYIVSSGGNMDSAFVAGWKAIPSCVELCIGSSEDGTLSELRKLYMEASHACSYAGRNEIINLPIVFKEQDMIRHIVSGSEAKLVAYIEKGDEDKVLETLDVIFTGLNIVESSIGTIRNEIRILLCRIADKFLHDGRYKPDGFEVESDNPELTLLRLRSQTYNGFKGLMNKIKYPKDVPLQMKELIRYVNQNYNKDINLAMISNLFNMNYYHASTLFNKHTGANFSDYLNKLRLEKAAELLKLSGVRVYDVAGQVGFTNIKYFFRKFKDYYSMTPVEFRNNFEAK